MSGAVKERRSIADYIDVESAGTSEYALMGTGFTELDEDLSPKTTTKNYVNMKSASTSTTGYEWSAPFTSDVIPDEKAVAFLYGIGERELVGAEAEANYVKVDLDKKVGATGTEYEARQRRVAVEVSNIKNNDGELQVSGNLKAKSDWVFGKFDTTAKTFTPEV